MNHLERMRALRRQVDIIIDHTETLAELVAHDCDTIGLNAFVLDRPDLKRHLVVPTVELRALVERRIAEAEAEIRKLGMVAPSPPGSDVLERVRQQPGVGPMYPDPRTPAYAQAEGLVVEPSSGLYVRRGPCDLTNPGS